MLKVRIFDVIRNTRSIFPAGRDRSPELLSRLPSEYRVLDPKVCISIYIYLVQCAIVVYVYAGANQTKPGVHLRVRSSSIFVRKYDVTVQHLQTSPRLWPYPRLLSRSRSPQILTKVSHFGQTPVRSSARNPVVTPCDRDP